VRPLGVALALAVGCGTPPDENACANIQPVAMAMGQRGPGGEWIVGEWTTPRLHWRALTTYAIQHGLGRPPVSVECWASFTPNGAFAKQIGNVCQVIPNCNGRDGVSGTEVIVRNSGAQDFWVRLVIR
jgi:hypothetical protein